MTRDMSESDCKSPVPKPPRDTENGIEEELTSSQKREVAADGFNGLEADSTRDDKYQTKLQDKAGAFNGEAETSADIAKTVQEVGGVVEEGVAVVDKFVEEPIKSEPVEADVIIVEETSSGPNTTSTATFTADTPTDSNTAATDTNTDTADTEPSPATISQSVTVTREIIVEDMMTTMHDGPPVHRNSPELGETLRGVATNPSLGTHPSVYAQVCLQTVTVPWLIEWVINLKAKFSKVCLVFASRVYCALAHMYLGMYHSVYSCSMACK